MQTQSLSLRLGSARRRRGTVIERVSEYDSGLDGWPLWRTADADNPGSIATNGTLTLTHIGNDFPQAWLPLQLTPGETYEISVTVSALGAGSFYFVEVYDGFPAVTNNKEVIASNQSTTGTHTGSVVAPADGLLELVIMGRYAGESVTVSEVTITGTAAVPVGISHADGIVSVSDVTDEIIAITVSGGTEFDGTYNVTVADLDAGPVAIVDPSVSGTFADTEVLTLDEGLWAYKETDGPLTLSWDWLRSGDAIAGAENDQTYTLTPIDITNGHEVAVQAISGAGTTVETTVVQADPSPLYVRKPAGEGIRAIFDASASGDNVRKFMVAGHFRIASLAGDLAVVALGTNNLLTLKSNGKFLLSGNGPLNLNAFDFNETHTVGDSVFFFLAVDMDGELDSSGRNVVCRAGTVLAANSNSNVSVAGTIASAYGANDLTLFGRGGVGGNNLAVDIVEWLWFKEGDALTPKGFNLDGNWIDSIAAGYGWVDLAANGAITADFTRHTFPGGAAVVANETITPTLFRRGRPSNWRDLSLVPGDSGNDWEPA